MDQKYRTRVLAGSLVAYLLSIGVGATLLIAVNFPEQSGKSLVFPEDESHVQHFVPLGKLASPGQGLICLALLAGAAGSFLHATQSLSTYIGNDTFKPSWATWYLLRPWIGAVLGFAIYFSLRTGLVAGVDTVNPYGVVAIGFLGGWFSKTTTDKLQQVFETCFKTDADKDRKDKVSGARPVVESIAPSPIPATQQEFVVRGTGFLAGAVVLMNQTQVPTISVSLTEIKCSLAGIARPPAGSRVSFVVKNPHGDDPISLPFQLDA